MAGSSNVQLYGVIDEGVTHFTGIAPAGAQAGNTETTSSTGLSSGVDYGSRIGLKGDENLGGGLSAFFDVETGFCAAGTSQDYGGQTYCTAGGFMQRQSYVGLKGDFGVLQGGREYTPNFNDEANVDPFGAGMTGQVNNLSLVGQLGMYRSSQTLTYVTPDISGFSGTAAYVFSAGSGTVPGSSPATANVPRAFTVAGEYQTGPVLFGATYTRLTNSTLSAAGFNDGNIDLWDLHGAYDFGVMKISGIYEDAKADYNSGSDKFWMLGVTVPVGSGAILASYSDAKNSSTWAPGAVAANGGQAKQYAIGYTYNLSKQTLLYSSCSHISNSNGSAVAVGDSTDYFPGVANRSSTGLALGIVHKF